MKRNHTISIFERLKRLFLRWDKLHIIFILSIISVSFFFFYLNNGLGLSYNDARSHLDIGRRVVEGLRPGLSQLGSVWLPLNHLLMIPLVWNDWMWHSGFAGAFWNMLSYVGTGYVIYLYLSKLKVGIIGRLVGVAVFAANLNILYLQSTAMTEPLLLFTMTTGSYYLLLYHESDEIFDLVKSAFWIMLATLTRYDGWFLLSCATALVAIQAWRKHGFKRFDGVLVLFLTLAALGVVVWLGWNQLIFGDALYWAFGPFSAHAQQQAMAVAGALPTKGNILLSTQVYISSLISNLYIYPVILGIIGMFTLWFDRRLNSSTRIASTALLSPLFFNIIALVLGFSIIQIPGVLGSTWFNIRYGVMLAPTIAIFIGYLIDRFRLTRVLIITSLIIAASYSFVKTDSVCVDDARAGSSQKNVTEVSSYLATHASNSSELILISVASHDAIIFSSGLPMARFIHEGTGRYWENATTRPDRFVKWIVMSTNNDQDLTWKAVSRVHNLEYYHKVAVYPFADVYELDESMLGNLINTSGNIAK